MAPEKLNHNKQKDQINPLDRAFDLLSSVPYLKWTMKTIWIIIVVLRIVIISWAFFMGGWSFVVEGGVLNKFSSYLIGVFVFWLMFYLWERREKQRNAQARVSGLAEKQ
ncbi:MAG: hypothetical protein KDK96_11025 [Chlamydiia bacterium]|nr:hypothetical protein [Chlamydiia bacterium]